VSKFGTKSGKKKEIAISPEPLVRFEWNFGIWTWFLRGSC